MRRLLLISLLPFAVCCLRGQTAVRLTTVVGEVTDARTGEPLEGVSVYFRGTDYGTATTPEGVFLLRAPLEKRAVMVVSAVGYKPQRFTVEAGRQAGIDVRLTEETAALEEVFVLPGSNPALALMDSVRAHSGEHRSALADRTGEGQVRAYLSGIHAGHLRKRLWKGMRSSLTPEITDSDTTWLLPVYNSADGTRTGADVWKVFVDETKQRADFYRPTVTYCGTSFLSPLAGSGLRYYSYVLADSVCENGRKTYEVRFRTKNPYYATFNGRLLVDSATYALRRVEASVPQETNANYLRDLRIVQDYVTDGPNYSLRDEQVTEILDVAVRADTTHTFPTLLIRSSYRMTDSQTAPSAVAPDRDNGTAAAADSVPTPPLLRVGNWLARIVLTGVIPTGTAVDFGKVTEIVRINNREKVRVGLPLRTNARMSESVCLEAYAAYGFGDRKWKGAGTVYYKLPTERRHILSAGYRDDYTAADADGFTRLKMENSAWYQDRSLTSHWTEPFWRGPVYATADVRRREFRLTAENDWRDGVETYGHLAFGSEEGFRYNEAGVTVRLSLGERKADLFFQRVHVYNSLPVVYLNGVIGSVRPSSLPGGGYDMYGKLRLMVRQRADLGMGGRLDWLAEAGCLFGDVPRTMGFAFAGNDSYAFDPYRFTLMHRGQFTARRYASLQAEWNGRGCLFNRIPWVQRLRLRELAVGKAAWGGDLKTPYVELGAGIGNILRVADLYAVFRVTRLDDTSSPWWAVRFRFHVEG